MYKKIFISNRAGIGDVILTTPVLRALKKKFPDSKITLMISPNSAQAVEGLDFIDEIITYDKKKDSVWKIVKHIWKYDLAICLDFKYRTAVMAFLARIPVRAGLKYKRGLFMTHAVEKNPRWENTYESYNYANIIKDSIGIELTGDFTQLYLPPAEDTDIKHVDNIFATSGVKKEVPLITIAPFTSWFPKNWPIGYYVKLIKFLIERYPHQIVLVGMASDFEKFEELCNSSRVTNAMGKTSLSQMIEVIRRSQLFIGGCSGPLHMAAALHIPFVAFYGPTLPEQWAPRTKGITLNRQLNCSPCNGPMIGCEEKTCMYEITVEDAFEACQKMLVNHN